MRVISFEAKYNMTMETAHMGKAKGAFSMKSGRLEGGSLGFNLLDNLGREDTVLSSHFLDICGVGLPFSRSSRD